MKSFFWTLLFLLIFFNHSPLILAQETDSEESAKSDTEDTSKDDNEDEKSPSLFDDEESDAEESDPAVPEGQAYILEFTTQTALTFNHVITGEPYMSVEYTTTLKEEIFLGKKRYENIGYADVQTEVTGYLAYSQFFSCQLEVEIERTLVDITTRTKQIAPESEDDTSDEAKTQVALSLSFDKDYSENWYSYCKGSNDSTLNTIALDAPENYNLKILDLMEPNLKGLLIEDFDLGQATSFEINIEPFDSEDIDTGEKLYFTGSGTITLTPR